MVDPEGLCPSFFLANDYFTLSEEYCPQAGNVVNKNRPQ